MSNSVEGAIYKKLKEGRNNQGCTRKIREFYDDVPPNSILRWGEDEDTDWNYLVTESNPKIADLLKKITNEFTFRDYASYEDDDEVDWFFANHDDEALNAESYKYWVDTIEEALKRAYGGVNNGIVRKKKYKYENGFCDEVTYTIKPEDHSTGDLEIYVSIQTGKIVMTKHY